MSELEKAPSVKVKELKPRKLGACLCSFVLFTMALAVWYHNPAPWIEVNSYSKYRFDKIFMSLESPIRTDD